MLLGESTGMKQLEVLAGSGGMKHFAEVWEVAAVRKLVDMSLPFLLLHERC